MKYIVALSFILAISGCDLNMQKNAESVSVSSSQEAVALSEPMKAMSKEDCLLQYKQYSGLTEYMANNGKSINNTIKLINIIYKFESDYGVDKNKYPEAKIAINDYMRSKQFNVPRTIVETDAEVTDKNKFVTRKEIVDSLRTAADAMKIALDSKNGK